MTTTPSLRLRVGERLWFDGQAWTVREISTQTADLVDSVGSQRRAALTDSIGAATNLTDEPNPPALGDDLAAILLSQLTKAQRREVEAQYDLLRPLLDKPLTSSELEAAAHQQGISARTLRRRIERASELGPAGCSTTASSNKHGAPSTHDGTRRAARSWTRWSTPPHRPSAP